MQYLTEVTRVLFLNINSVPDNYNLPVQLSKLSKVSQSKLLIIILFLGHGQGIEKHINHIQIFNIDTVFRLNIENRIKKKGFDMR